MTDIQRYEPWPQEWPQEDLNGSLVTYEDHKKVVDALQTRMEALIKEGAEWATLCADYHDKWVSEKARVERLLVTLRDVQIYGVTSIPLLP